MFSQFAAYHESQLDLLGQMSADRDGSRREAQTTRQRRSRAPSLAHAGEWRYCSSAQWHRPMRRSAAVMVAGKRTSKRRRNGHHNSPRHRRHRRLCRSHGHGWTLARSCASRATLSSDIRRKSPMVRVLQQRERRPTVVPSRSRSASRSWTVTVLHAPKSLRRMSPNRPAGPIPCHRPRHPLSPKVPAQGNDGDRRRFDRARYPRQARGSWPRGSDSVRIVTANRGA
jgi:hypothetical protein